MHGLERNNKHTPHLPAKLDVQLRRPNKVVQHLNHSPRMVPVEKKKTSSAKRNKRMWQTTSYIPSCTTDNSEQTKSEPPAGAAHPTESFDSRAHVVYCPHEQTPLFSPPQGSSGILQRESTLGCVYNTTRRVHSHHFYRRQGPQLRPNDCFKDVHYNAGTL